MTDPTHKHHEGLPHEEIRDMIASKIKSAPVHVGFWSNDPEYRAIMVANLKAAQQQIEDFDLGRGLRIVANSLGLREYDVSDRVSYNKETYHAFIGTPEEVTKVYPGIDPEQ